MPVDSHIHLSMFSYGNTFPYLDYDGTDLILRTDGTRDRLISEMRERGIRFCVEPAIEMESNEALLALAHAYPGFVYPAVGVHPTRTHTYMKIDSDGQRQTVRLKHSRSSQLEQYVKDPSVIAVGETGLDYHLAAKEQHRITQKIWFIRQILLAHKHKLPLILHIRQADDDALRILRFFRGMLHGGICHCFSGNAVIAGAYTALGFKIGIGGALLSDHDPRRDIEDAVRNTPLEYIVLETDGPYVKPACPNLTGKQIRKARNTSLIIPAIAGRVAELKGVSLAEVEAQTTRNVCETFHIPEV